MELPSIIALTVNDNIITLSDLDIVILDHNIKKIVIARLSLFLKPIVLWRGDQYDNVGDYTQAQVEARILELLGDDIQTFLQSLVI